MTSSAQARSRRKAAPARRAEIVAAASTIALADGLGSVTLRNVATTVDVFPGLINHYFRSVDDLVAAAFGHAARAELDTVFAAVDVAAEPLARLRALVDLLAGPDRDAVSLLWLDAWQGSRYRPALRDEVVTQMRAWQERVGELIAVGVDSGAVDVTDPLDAAVRILAVVDGLSIQAAVRDAVDYGTVRDMVVGTVERELGLPAGTLRR